MRTKHGRELKITNLFCFSSLEKKINFVSSSPAIAFYTINIGFFFVVVVVSCALNGSVSKVACCPSVPKIRTKTKEYIRLLIIWLLVYILYLSMHSRCDARFRSVFRLITITNPIPSSICTLIEFGWCVQFTFGWLHEFLRCILFKIRQECGCDVTKDESSLLFSMFDFLAFFTYTKYWKTTDNKPIEHNVLKKY